MKILPIVAMAALMLASCNKPTYMADYQVIPMPVSVENEEGLPFHLNDKVSILYDSSNEKMARNAAFLISYVKEQTGIELVDGYVVDEKGCIKLSLGLDNNNPEAYELKVDENEIEIKGASEAGVFYGIQTLRKSLPVIKTGKVFLPQVEVKDEPRFAYRGMHFDVCRHFFTTDEVKTYIDMLAIHNINRLHWHLTEDQGWRIEIKKYPNLTKIGSMRAQTVIGKTNEYDGIPHGGFYTQDEIRDIVKYAAERYITIIPEIDMPGHMQAALASYPELGCTGGPYKVRERWGISKDVLCAGNPATLEFAKDILTEVMELFPSDYIHVGGDECTKDEWIKCPKCQAVIEKEGFKDDKHHTKEQRLQSWWMSEIEKFINANGRRMIGWDEILEGGCAENATVMVWRDIKEGVKAMNLGHDIIMTPCSHLYFDYYQSQDLDEPLCIGGYSSVNHVYNYEPFPDGIDKNLYKHVLGVQANLWTEYVPDFKKVQYMVLPRMDALCEVQWTMPENKDFHSFATRLPKMISIYERLDWHYATHVFDIQASQVSNPETGNIEVTLNTMGESAIYYTLDGSEPSAKSPLYTGPVEIQDCCQMKAIAVHPTRDSKIFTMDITTNKLVKDIKLLTAPNERYKFDGASVLANGLAGHGNYRSGEWLGYVGNNLEAIVELKKETEISEVSFNTWVETGDWVFDARGFKVELSLDAESFTTVFDEEYAAMTEGKSLTIMNHKAKFDPVTAKYVKVTIKPEDCIPDFHIGRGKHAFIFVDEIFVK